MLSFFSWSRAWLSVNFCTSLLGLGIGETVALSCFEDTVKQRTSELGDLCKMSRVKWSWFCFLTLLMASFSCLGFRVYRALGSYFPLSLEFAADSQPATGSDSTCAGDSMGNGGSSLSGAEELSQLALQLEQEAL